MERWLLTYADMITLLLALFVVLFALSSISVKKFLEFKLGMTQTFSPTAISENSSTGLLQQTSLVQQADPGATQIGSTTSTSASSRAAVASATAAAARASAAQLDQIAAAVARALARKHLSNAASVTVSTKGVIVQVLADKAFFATDSARLGRVGDEVVDTIAQVIRPRPNRVVVQGYTDNVPIVGGPYNSNWELSAVRAADVVNRLNVVDGIAEARLSAEGYGSTRPLVANTTPIGRAKNRRVDVVILSTSGS